MYPQDLMVRWQNNQTKVAEIMSDWLNTLGKKSTPYTLADYLVEGKVLILPYKSWAHHGLSGSSTPNTVILDYYSVTAALVNREDAQRHLTEVYYRNGLISVQDYVHYGAPDESLCGLIKGDKTASIGAVTCPHCLFEINFRAEPANDIPA